MKINNEWINIIKVLFGTFLIAVGISIVINNDYGMDTISTFLLGILNHINFPFWMLSLKFNCIIILIIYCLDPEELGIGSLLNAMTMGLMLFFLAPIFELAVVITPYYSILALFLGPLFLGIGGAIYVSGGMGAASLEALTNILLKKTNFSFRFIRIFLDGVLVGIGFLLGAPIGIGTIMCVVFIGPILEVSLNKLC